MKNNNLSHDINSPARTGAVILGGRISKPGFNRAVSARPVGVSRDQFSGLLHRNTVLVKQGAQIRAIPAGGFFICN